MYEPIKDKYTKREIMAALRKELREYEASIGSLTPVERERLREWVADGHSAYENPYLLYGVDGRPFCFIEAFRINADMYENPEDYGIVCT